METPIVYDVYVHVCTVLLVLVVAFVMVRSTVSYAACVVVSCGYVMDFRSGDADVPAVDTEWSGFEAGVVPGCGSA